MKLQWMKDILGDAYTDEMDAKVSAALGERFVARADFNEKTGKVKELETQVTQLNEGIKTRDKQLEDLKKSAGDNEELTKQIETLTQQNKDAKANYDKELAKVKLMAAVDAELTAAGSKNNTAVRAVLAEFLEDAKIVDGKVTATVGGETITLANKVEALKRTLPQISCLGRRPSMRDGNPAMEQTAASLGATKSSPRCPTPSWRTILQKIPMRNWRNKL